MNIDVSIVFVNYKTKDLTIQAVKSVLSKTKGINFEIYVIDNNSQDGSIEAIENEFPNINIIKNPINAGFGAANNLAIKQAKGKYILCLNTDTLLINNAIKILYDFMEKEENKNVGACGGGLYDSQGLPLGSAGHFPCITQIFYRAGLKNILKKQYKKYSFELTIDDIKTLDNIDYISGSDIFFRKNILDKVGLFDENFFMYLEEAELCKRIVDKGYNCKIVPDAKIIHYEFGSTENNANTIKRKKISRSSEFYYFKKHHPKKVFFVKIIYLMLYFIDGYILMNKESRELFKFVCNYNIYLSNK